MKKPTDRQLLERLLNLIEWDFKYRYVESEGGYTDKGGMPELTKKEYSRLKNKRVK